MYCSNRKINSWSAFSIKFPIALFSYLFLFTNIFSQEFKVANISLPDGLSQSSIYCISQDKTGFLWVGTQDGLNKYDGLNFTTYYNQPFDTTSVSSAFIMSLINDSKNRNWIGTFNNGLNLKLPSEEKFIRFSRENKKLPDNNIKCLYEDSGNNILVGTIRDVTIFRQDQSNNSVFTLENLKTDNNKRAFEIVTAVCEKNSLEYWIGTRNGVFLIEYSKNNSKIKFELSDKERLKNEITKLINDSKGNLWIGTNGGIIVLDNANNVSRKIDLPKNNYMSNMIYDLCFASDGSLWIASGDGLFQLSAIEVNNISVNEPKPTKILPEERLLEGALFSVAEDKINKGLIWVGTESNGILKLAPNTKKFSTNNLSSVLKTPFVFSLLKDQNEFIWIGTTSGLFRYDRNEEKYLKFTHSDKNPNSIPGNFISVITETKSNEIFLGSPYGLVKVVEPNSSHPSFKHITVNNKFPHAAVRNIKEKDSLLYLVLPLRVFSYDPEKNTTKEIVYIPESISGKYSDFRLNAMAFDESGNLWLGSSHGLFLFRKNHDGYVKMPESFFHHLDDTTSLRCQTINGITVTKNDEIWICTSNGFSKVLKKGESFEFKNYSTQNGLKNNAVYAAIEDPFEKNLWLSTNGGLTKFNPQSEHFTNYDVHDGLQSNEFNGGSYFRSEDNEFFFGGVNGYTSFYPKEILTDKQPPNTIITSFSLNGSEIKFSPAEKKEIELKFNQNSFTIDFIALHFINPIKNSYEYMLEGYQKEWTKSGNIHSVIFTQLPAGEYLFKVKGANNDGIAGENTDSLKIIIHPPFWNTIWFYVIIASLVLISFWLIHWLRLRMKLNQIKQIENIRKEIASDFHDELGHKLTTISWFSEILHNRLKPEEKDQRKYLIKIIETSGSLYHTMKDLLWAMDPAKDSVADLYFQIREFGESLFDQTGVEFSASDPPTSLNDENLPLAYKRHVLLILKEAMNNSFKHSKSTMVNLEVFRENNHVTIQLRDNGKGFNTEPSSMGYGLKNVTKRTQLIHGKIFINSDESGTKVTLEVPLCR
jgi:ligand-binding sensor domain-containing protein